MVNLVRSSLLSMPVMEESLIDPFSYGRLAGVRKGFRGNDVLIQVGKNTTTSPRCLNHVLQQTDYGTVTLIRVFKAPATLLNKLIDGRAFIPSSLEITACPVFARLANSP